MMIALSVENLQKSFGPEPVLAGVNFEVHLGDRVGLVGPNGTGKTTLLRIIAGKQEPDAGKCEVHPSIRLGYLEQEPALELHRTVWEEARGALAELIGLQQQAIEAARSLAQATDEAEHRRLAARYDRLQQELHRRDAYHLDHKIARVLEGLGFRQSSFQLPIQSLSGGERSRLMLARLLLAEPDLMLLDEPSNHLDIEATQWLEEFLTSSQAAMILVSHDRYFLDRVCTRTFELFRGTVEVYSGNFSAYRQQKAQRLLVERRAYEKQQREIAKAEEFIRRTHYGQKHAQAEDRRKKLQRMKRLEPPREICGPVMGFPPASRSGEIVLRAENLSKGYGAPLFAQVDIQIVRGQRWAILGPNGSGKTTLLRCLLGQIQPDTGCATLGHGVQVGYFDQHLSSIQDHLPAVDVIQPDRPDCVEQTRRDILARFGLTKDQVFQPVGKLSGGERCRVALAKLAAAKANLLALDEPTNHLDLWAREALERSLNQFEGTVLLVSHDRYFVNQVADHLLVIEPGRVRVIEGNYNTYLHLVQAGLAGSPSCAPGQLDGKTPPLRGAGQSQPAATQRKRRFPYRKLEELEQEISEREHRLEALQLSLADPLVVRDGDRARHIKAQIAEEQETLQRLYAHWEEAAELNW